MKKEKAFIKCRYFGKSHSSDECQKCVSIEDRRKRIKGSCCRYLKEGHLSSECKASKSCVYYGAMNTRHRSLCEKKFKRSNPKESVKESVHLSGEIEVARHADIEK